MRNVTILDKVRFIKSGATYTVEEFAIKLTDNDIAVARYTIDALIAKGDVVIVESKSDEQKVIDAAAKKALVEQAAEAIDQEQEDRKDRIAEMKKQGKLTHKEVKIEYATSYQAQQAKAMYEEQLRIDVDFMVSKDVPYLVFHDITEKELDFITRTYKADKAIAATVGVVSTGAERVTKAVDYTAKKVATPILEIGARSATSILKSSFSVLAKTGATLINAGYRGVKETYEDITTDPDIIKARAEVIGTQSAIKRALNGRGTGSTSGITITD
jgi:hypothetical protein